MDVVLHFAAFASCVKCLLMVCVSLQTLGLIRIVAVLLLRCSAFQSTTEEQYFQAPCLPPHLED